MKSNVCFASSATSLDACSIHRAASLRTPFSGRLSATSEDIFSTASATSSTISATSSTVSATFSTSSEHQKCNTRIVRSCKGRVSVQKKKRKKGRGLQFPYPYFQFFVETRLLASRLVKLEIQLFPKSSSPCEKLQVVIKLKKNHKCIY